MEMKREDYQAIVDDLKQEYGDFTLPENKDRLLEMLEERFRPVARNYFSTCDMEGDKIYLWIWSDNWDSPNLRNISSMKFLHCFGFQISHEFDGEYDSSDIDPFDLEDYERQEEIVERGRQVFGTDMYPTLSDFAGRQVECNYRGASQLGDLITTATRWDVTSLSECPLVAVHRFFNFYSARSRVNSLDNLQRTTVLYENYGAVAYNGWSGPLFAYELLPKRKQAALNYPSGITLK